MIFALERERDVGTPKTYMYVVDPQAYIALLPRHWPNLVEGITQVYSMHAIRSPQN